MLAFFVRHATKPSSHSSQLASWQAAGGSSALLICESHSKTAFLHHTAQKMPILSIDVSKKYLSATMRAYLFDGDLYANDDRVAI